MLNKYSLVFLLGLMMVFASCDQNGGMEDDNPPPPVPLDTTYYFVGVEAASEPTTDILSLASSLKEGEVSPVGNGYEQASWSSFIQGVDQIFAAGYTSAPEFTSYEVVDGALVQGGSFFTDLGVYAHEVVDESTMILMGSAREGLSAKKIYVVNTDDMAIENTYTVDFGNDEENNLIAFPVDLKVRGDKMFAAYYMITADNAFSTPFADQARVAVFSYPSMEFEKIITDDRAPNLGRYYSVNTLEEDEQGNIYSFAPSSMACGYFPVPSKNSAVLRIPAGETEFDTDYYIDFEDISGGYKINDMYYVADGKAVVRVVSEDESNISYYWANYAPTSEVPLLATGILDLNAQTFTLLEDIPLSGGGWESATLKEGNTLYLGVSNSTLARIYSIDVSTGTVTQGASIDGNYAKALLSIRVQE